MKKKKKKQTNTHTYTPVSAAVNVLLVVYFPLESSESHILVGTKCSPLPSLSPGILCPAFKLNDVV